MEERRKDYSSILEQVGDLKASIAENRTEIKNIGAHLTNHVNNHKKMYMALLLIGLGIGSLWFKR